MSLFSILLVIDNLAGAAEFFCDVVANKPERVFGLQVRCRELDIFKILGIFGELFGNCLENFWEFFGNSLRNSLGTVNDCLHF